MELKMTSKVNMALSKVLLDIVAADGKVSKEEKVLFSHIQEIFKIPLEDIKMASSLGVLEALAILRTLSKSDKDIIVIMMIDMVTVDGNVDDNELTVLRVVCNGIGVSLPDSLR